MYANIQYSVPEVPNMKREPLNCLDEVGAVWKQSNSMYMSKFNIAGI